MQTDIHQPESTPQPEDAVEQTLPSEEVLQTPAPVQQPPPRRFDMRILFILLIVIGIGGGVFLATRPAEIPPVPTPRPTTIPPSPTPRTQPKLPIATDSSYLMLTTQIASFSAYLNLMQPADTTLVPPTIELQLGFSNQ